MSGWDRPRGSVTRSGLPSGRRILPLDCAERPIIVAAGLSGRKASALIRARADLQTKLLDRLGSGREVVEFCQTEGGKQFIEALSMGTVDSPASKGRLPSGFWGLFRKGIILTLLGLGFLLLAEKYPKR